MSQIQVSPRTASGGPILFGPCRRPSCAHDNYRRRQVANTGLHLIVNAGLTVTAKRSLFFFINRDEAVRIDGNVCGEVAPPGIRHTDTVPPGDGRRSSLCGYRHCMKKAKIPVSRYPRRRSSCSSFAATYRQNGSAAVLYPGCPQRQT
jgi:hypothetical protein